MDPSLTESAHSLGASRVKAFLNIEIPLAMPGIITGLYLAGITAFSDFGTPMIITLDLEMLPKLIYQEFMNEIGGETHIASAGSMVMIFISGIFLAGQRLFLAGKSYSSITASKRQLDKPNIKIKLFIYIFSFFILSISFLPHLVVIITSFFEWSSGVVTNNLTLVNYKDLINTELMTIWVSLSTATGATILSFVFGTTIAYILIRKNYKIINFILNTLVMIPLIIPGTVFAIGLILVFNDEPIVLTGTWLILTLSYFLRKLPFSVKTSEASLYQLHPALEEVALSLGSKPLRVFVFITLPMMISGAITGMTLVFLRSITELSSTILLFRPPWKTMSIVIFERTIAPGTNFGIAASMAVLMMLITYLPLYLLSKGRNFEVT
jgi:iron(III) transport system permease protein